MTFYRTWISGLQFLSIFLMWLFAAGILIFVPWLVFVAFRWNDALNWSVAISLVMTPVYLTVAGTRVPAGSYTLWTTFTASSATLIINSQTGQWGTAYDGSQDFARIAMEREALDETVERFTIDVEPTDSGATLRLRWDRTQFSVPMTAR